MDAAGELIVEFYESLSGTPKEKLKIASQLFEISPLQVKRTIQFWWPGVRHIAEFGERETR